MRSRYKIRSIAAVAATGMALAGLAACSPSSGEAASGEDDTSEIVVWTDATRQAGFEQYADDHPEENIRVVLIPADAGYTSTQIALANKANSGWPDVVFLAGAGEIAQLASANVDFAAPLQELIPEDVQGDFLAANLKNCTFGGNLVCLPNDVGTTALWYNAKLMDEFGYDVPTTWDEYQAIGEKVATEHPGYVVGFGAEDAANSVFFGSSNCPEREVVGENEVHIDMAAKECTRVTDLLQPLADNGTLPLVGPNDPSFVEIGKANKVLMMPGAGYYGDFVFKANFATPAGELAAAVLPTWAGEDQPYSGVYGGGVFAVSKHATESKQKKAAAIIEWMTTDIDWQSAQPTYPAYEPAADAWGEKKATDPFYASDPFPALQAMADAPRGTWNFVRYQTVASQVYTQTVIAAARDGGTLASGLPAMQDALVEAAEATNYEVVQ